MAGKRWNGSTFVDIATTRKRWNGSAWVDLTIAKRWNGTAWIDIFPDLGGGPPPDPSLPTASWVGGSSDYSGHTCIGQVDPPVSCPVSYTFTLFKSFTSSGATTITGKAVSGISYNIVGNNVTFSCTVSRRPPDGDPIEKIPVLQFTNASGTTELAFRWTVFYEYYLEGTEPE
jgi:hypothetical protein